MLHNEVASSSGVFYEAFCGDAAKYEAHLAMHEAAPRAMKQSLTASFAIFLNKKNGGEREIRTPGGLHPGGFQDRCLKPLDHLSGSENIQYHLFYFFQVPFDTTIIFFPVNL